MATGRETQLTGAVGEFRVAAELCRLGLLATPFAGNVPHYDVVASGRRGGHLAIQVKAINKGGAWQFNIQRFLRVRLEGRRQIPGRLVREPYPGLVCVLVVLDRTGADRFFVLTWKELRKIVARGYRRYLRDRGGIRPKVYGSFHTALSVDAVARFEGRWQLIVKAIRKMPNPRLQPSAPGAIVKRRG